MGRLRGKILAAATSLAASSAIASNPLYSFETLYNSTGVPDPAGTRPDDFHPNGGGTVITQDTIGATDQAHSMKFTQVAGQFFSGPITELLPDHLNDDNSMITMDVTIPDGGQFNGNFARMGISEFGTNPNIMGSSQVQTNIFNEANVARAPGTYHIGIPLIAISNPVTFDTNVSFHSCFGPDTSSQLTPADWEFYVNKSTDSSLIIYVDNIKSEILLPGDDNFDGRVNALDFNVLATNYGGSGKSLSSGDFNGDGTVDSQDFNILASNFNRANPPAAALGTVVPEPAIFVAAFMVAAMTAQRRRSRRIDFYLVNKQSAV